MLLPEAPKLTNETPSAREKRLSDVKSTGAPKNVFEGKRDFVDGLGENGKQGFWSWLLAITTLTFVACWFHILVGLLLFCWVPWVRVAIVLLISTVLLPACEWDAFKHGAILRSWRQYFNYSIIVKYALRHNVDKSYLFCWFPHGVLAFGWMSAAGTDTHYFRDRKVYGIAGSSVFYIPLFRHLSACLGGLPATRVNINRLLEMGRAVVFLSVGGMAEMFLTSNRKTEQIYLKDRKGFLRLAVAGGHTIIPMYVFGQSQMLTLWSPKFLGSLSRKLGFTMGFLYGRWGLPIPRPIDCMVVTGLPIDCGPAMSKDEPGFDEKVEQLHAQFTIAIKDIFETHKKEYGWGHKQLRIL
ncbi:hypothetical protein BSKO_04455 [Bryopsis sp. KO-2023]|nr:hypothetical protein BSKO_04455 [Bryopsis sp. KO-2023]